MEQKRLILEKEGCSVIIQMLINDVLDDREEADVNRLSATLLRKDKKVFS